MDPMTLFLAALALHAAIGLAFAVAFVLRGAGRIDPVARHAPLSFRLLILPGSAALWPLLLKKWLSARAALRNSGSET